MDIDIDFPDRNIVLSKIKHIPASIYNGQSYTKHNSGVYITDIPVNPLNGLASIDYKSAEELGYMKLDFLNMGVYSEVKDRAHLDRLFSVEPMWEMLRYREFVENVIHINNHYDILKKMPEPVDSIPRMAMFISVIRPAKRHLIGKPWKDVAKDVWVKEDTDKYGYKHSHAISYAHLVAVHMNLLCGID